jgi:hypothetical protein
MPGIIANTEYQIFIGSIKAILNIIQTVAIINIIGVKG